MSHVRSLAAFGGTKRNAFPVTDSTTDYDAPEDNLMRAAAAAVTHTQTLAWCRFTTAATTGTLVLVAHDALWGSLGGVAPTLTRVSAGIFEITWPSSVDDEVIPPNTETLNLRWARPNHRSTSYRDVNAIPQSANVVRVYVRDNTLALADVVGTDIDVWVG